MPTVRLAKASEFHTIVQVITTAFEHESYVSWLHSGHCPTPEARLEDLKRYWRKELRKKWYDPTHYFLVSVNSEEDAVGAAIWKSPEADKRSLVREMKKCMIILVLLAPKSVLKPLQHSFVALFDSSTSSTPSSSQVNRSTRRKRTLWFARNHSLLLSSITVNHVGLWKLSESCHRARNKVAVKAW